MGLERYYQCFTIDDLMALLFSGTSDDHMTEGPAKAERRPAHGAPGSIETPRAADRTKPRASVRAGGGAGPARGGTAAPSRLVLNEKSGRTRTAGNACGDCRRSGAWAG